MIEIPDEIELPERDLTEKMMNYSGVDDLHLRRAPGRRGR